jgi:hypothetical protein
MSDTLLVSTRKGLFTVSRKRGAWAISAVDFLGDNVSVTLADHRDGRRYAALDHGHFGVKLHRSTATGWEEIAAPDVSTQTGRLRRDRYVGPAAELEHGSHLGARVRRRRRARRHLVWNASGRSFPLKRSRAELGDDASPLGPP